MNLGVFLRRMLGKATLVLGSGSSLAPSARVLNARGDSSFIRIGKNSRIEGELFVFAHGGEIRVGDWSFVGPGSRIWSAGRIEIGNRVLISHNCTIMDSMTHPLEPERRHQQVREILTRGHPGKIDLDEKPVTVEDDAWIGAGATILRGVRIGRGAVVGAASVVTRDVPGLTVVAGNPARELRKIGPT